MPQSLEIPPTGKVLHTSQLTLRPCAMGDLEAVQQLWTEAAIRRFLFDDQQISLAQTRSLIAASTASFAQHGYGIWLFFAPQSDQIAGFSGLLPIDQAPPQLMFGTRSQFWRRGYAKAATLAVLRYAFDQLGLARIVADVDAPNQASMRLLEGLGMVRVGQAIGHHQQPLLYYELLANAPLNRGQGQVNHEN
jgi:[ribosomal protein S5]-alanine N-acetyltransferase